MKLLYLTLLGLLLLSYQSSGKKARNDEFDDNDFAEFEDDGKFMFDFYYIVYLFIIKNTLSNFVLKCMKLSISYTY